MLYRWQNLECCRGLTSGIFELPRVSAAQVRVIDGALNYRELREPLCRWRYGAQAILAFTDVLVKTMIRNGAM